MKIKRKNKAYDNLVKNVAKGLTEDKKPEDIKEPEKVEENSMKGGKKIYKKYRK